MLQHCLQSSADLVCPHVVRGVCSKWRRHFHCPSLGLAAPFFLLAADLFFWRTATKHFTKFRQRFVLRAFCVLVTSKVCFSFLCLPAFNFHQLFSFFFAPRLQFLHFSTQLSAYFTVSPLFLPALACDIRCIIKQSISLRFSLMISICTVHSDSLKAISCQPGCTHVLTDLASWLFKVRAVFSKTFSFRHVSFALKALVHTSPIDMNTFTL